MKALIAAETESLINKYKILLEKNNYATIIYRWVLKAVDNLEEINPDIILISVSDYPRQWKTVVQYVRTIFTPTAPTIYLISEKELSEEDEEIAQVLNCKKITTETFNTIHYDSENIDEKTTEEADEKETIFLNTFAFNHPKTGLLISGTVKHYNSPLFTFIPNDKKDISSLRFGIKIANATLDYDSKSQQVSVQIQGIDEDSIEFCILTKHKP
ncbi:MAG TPA: hypothetical protein VFC68_05330 [Treponemataceae bacterium]|nr:hypothetical protein [Treponemataceae bacterium]